jgi:hypothetical protein
MYSLLTIALAADVALPVQGLMTNTAGQPIEGPRAVVFHLQQTSEGAPIWSSPQTVEFEGGRFSTSLGPDSALETAILSGAAWLAVEVDGATSAAVALAGAARAMDANALGGVPASGYRRISDPVPWSNVTGAPAYVATVSGGLTLTGTSFAVDETVLRTGWITPGGGLALTGSSLSVDASVLRAGGTTTATPTFNASGPPFAVGPNAADALVDGLNAERIGGATLADLDGRYRGHALSVAWIGESAAAIDGNITQKCSSKTINVAESGIYFVQSRFFWRTTAAGSCRLAFCSLRVDGQPIGPYRDAIGDRSAIHNTFNGAMHAGYTFGLEALSAGNHTVQLWCAGYDCANMTMECGSSYANFVGPVARGPHWRMTASTSRTLITGTCASVTSRTETCTTANLGATVSIVDNTTVQLKDNQGRYITAVNDGALTYAGGSSCGSDTTTSIANVQTWTCSQ